MSAAASWSDAQIHAYVDGELDADAAARLAADSRHDAVLAARIAQQRELRSLLRGTFDPVLEEPVPQRLRDALTASAPGAAVTPIGAAQKQRARARPAWALREWGAIAATLVLGVLIGTLVMRQPGGLPLEMAQGRLVARGKLDTALSSQLSGSAPDAAIHVGLSFRAANGAYCRTFSQRGGPAGIACRNARRWSVQLLDGSAQAEAAGDYRQAGSALSPAMLGAITALGGGEALTTAQEQQQLSVGWQ
ncbi:MAG TPA: hypothetical protein VN645_04760 [Steroidobacteraceae bacterium]|nr:hypothetical protein [Steroidobacteraceae bacterium]